MKCQAKLAGRQMRLTGHKYLRNKWSQKDVSSWSLDPSCEVCVSLHFTRTGFSIPMPAGVVVEKGSEYTLSHTGPRKLDRHSLGVCGLGFGLVPVYTTLSVKVWANMNSVS